MGVFSGPLNGVAGLPDDHSWDRKLFFVHVWPEQTKFSLSPCWDKIKSVACARDGGGEEVISKTWTSDW